MINVLNFNIELQVHMKKIDIFNMLFECTTCNHDNVLYAV